MTYHFKNNNMKKTATLSQPKQTPEQHLALFFERNKYYAARKQHALISRKDRATVRSIVGHAIETAKIEPSEYQKLRPEKKYDMARASSDIDEKTSLCANTRYWLSQLIQRVCIEAQNDQMQGFLPAKNSW